MARSTSFLSPTTAPGTYGVLDSIANINSSMSSSLSLNSSRRLIISLFDAVAWTTNLRTDRLVGGVMLNLLLGNLLNLMHIIRMELLKEPIVRLEKRLRLWYKRRPSLDKS
jgi:hypothetical protein